MFVRFAVSTMVFVSAIAARAEAIAVSQTDEYCFDLAVIAGPPREFAIPGTSDPDDLIGHSTWREDISIDDVLVGTEKRKQIRAYVVKHNRWNPEIRHWLFLLRSRPNGEYDDVGGDYRIIADDNGELFIPLTEPASDDWLFPSGPIPRSYQALLKPVRYASHQTGWLREHDEVEPEVLDSAWAYRKGRYIVARRGLYLTDWADAMKHEPGAICPKR